PRDAVAVARPRAHLTARHPPVPPTSVHLFLFHSHGPHRALHSFPTRRSSDLTGWVVIGGRRCFALILFFSNGNSSGFKVLKFLRSEEHTSELQSRFDLVCRLLLEKKKKASRSEREGVRHAGRR